MAQKKGLFQELRIKTVANDPAIKVNTLVVGEDHFAAEFAYHLLQGKKNTDLLLLNAAKMAGNFEEYWRFQRPSTLRGEHNVQALRILEKACGNEEVELVATRPALFMKEQKFRPFSGRMRPEKLLLGEAFFTVPAITYDYHKHFQLFAAGVEGSHLLSTISRYNKIRRIEHITSDGRDDWQITCTSGEVFQCEKLFWSQGVLQFFTLLEPKQDYPLAFANYLARWQSTGALRIRFVFTIPITDQVETLFFPLSYSEEQGHFIGEFFPDGEKQILEICHFFNSEEDNEEEIAKKIRLLKRQLAKIYPHFISSLCQESIQIGNHCLNEVIDDQSWPQFHSLLPGVHFLGMDAPLSDFFGLDTRQITSETRGLLSLFFAKKM